MASVGPSTYRRLTATADTNADVVKSSAGRLRSIRGYNAASSVRYLKIYNSVTGGVAPVVGTDVPVKTHALAPTAAFTFDYGADGPYFSVGIGIGMTTAVADASTAALTANDVVGLDIMYR